MSVPCPSATSTPTMPSQDESSVPVPVPPPAQFVHNGQNRETIYCTNCPSKILLPMTAKWTTCLTELPKMSQPKGTAQVLTDLISGAFEVNDPFTFENIGFSKTVDGKLKYLICADCEVGPVGWQEVPGDLCYLAPTRVRHGLEEELLPNGTLAPPPQHS